MSTDRQLNRRVYYLINYTSYFYNASMMIIKYTLYLKIFKNILKF